jgi:hypothetical protein
MARTGPGEHLRRRGAAQLRLTSPQESVNQRISRAIETSAHWNAGMPKFMMDYRNSSNQQPKTVGKHLRAWAVVASVTNVPITARDGIALDTPLRSVLTPYSDGLSVVVPDIKGSRVVIFRSNSNIPGVGCAYMVSGRYCIAHILMRSGFRIGILVPPYSFWARLCGVTMGVRSADRRSYSSGHAKPASE